MTLIEKLKEVGKYAALGLASISLAVSVPAKATELEPLKQVLTLESNSPYRLDINLELNNTLEKKVKTKKFLIELDEELPDVQIHSEQQDYNGSELINFKEHSKLFDDYNKKPFDFSKWFLKLPAYSLAGFAGMIFWHELGHARKALYFGAEDIKIHGPELSKGKVGSTSYSFPSHHDITPHEKNIICAAGVEATSVMSNYLYQSLKTGNIPESIEPFAATTALIMMIDRHSYLWSTAIKNYLRKDIPRSNDFHDIMTKAFDEPLLDGIYVDIDDFSICGVFFQKGHFYRKDNEGKYQEIMPYVNKEGNFHKLVDKNNYKNVRVKQYTDKYGIKRHRIRYVNPRQNKIQKNIDIAYGVALGMSVIEIGLRWKEISYLANTALGNNPKLPEGHDILKAGFYPIDNGIFVGIDGVW